MADVASKILQIGLEGMYTPGGSSSALSVYNGGSPVAANRRIAVNKGLGVDFKPTFQKSTAQRGHYGGRFVTLLQGMEASGKFPADVFCDDLYFLLKMIVSGVPTSTPLPASPISLLAATAIAATLPALTTQPSAGPDGALAMQLAITLSNSAPQTTAVVVTVTGTVGGVAGQTETINFTAGTTTPSVTGGGTGALTCTLYTKNYFSNVSSIACSAQPVGDLVAVKGLYGWLDVYQGDSITSTLLSGTGEYYDGTAAWQIPGMVGEKFSFNAGIGKSFTADMSFMAQKKIELAATAASITPAAPTGTRSCLTNLLDNIMSAVDTTNASFYADPIGAAPGTTLISNRMTNFKFDVDGAAKLGHAANQSPYPGFVGRDFYGDKTSAEFDLLFLSDSANVTDPTEVKKFLTAASRVVRAAFGGPALPTGPLSGVAGWPAWAQVGGVGGFYGLAFDVPGKYEAMTEKDEDGRIAHAYKMAPEVDLQTLGTLAQVSIITRNNPNM